MLSKFVLYVDGSKVKHLAIVTQELEDNNLVLFVFDFGTTLTCSNASEVYCWKEMSLTPSTQTEPLPAS